MSPQAAVARLQQDALVLPASCASAAGVRQVSTHMSAQTCQFTGHSVQQPATTPQQQMARHKWCGACSLPTSRPLLHALQVMHSALDWLQRERTASELSIMLVVGLPNSGKSSLINALKLAAKKRGAHSWRAAHAHASCF